MEIISSYSSQIWEYQAPYPSPPASSRTLFYNNSQYYLPIPSLKALYSS
jgi:hypothetical protein